MEPTDPIEKRLHAHTVCVEIMCRETHAIGRKRPILEVRQDR